MKVYLIKLFFYSLTSLLAYGMSIPAFSSHRMVSYNTYLKNREDCRQLFTTQYFDHYLTYTGIEFKTSPQPYTVIPSLMLSLGQGYRTSLTSSGMRGIYIFLDYGADLHHKAHTKLNNFLYPIRTSSFAAAYLLKSIDLNLYHPMPQETQFFNLNIGLEYWNMPHHGNINLYIPLSSTINTSSQLPYYIEDGHYGIDAKVHYVKNSTFSSFIGAYLFYRNAQSNMVGLAYGVTVAPYPDLNIDLKYTVDSLRGHAWTIAVQYQVKRWLKFNYRYNYNTEEGHTTTPRGLKGLFFGLQWHFEPTTHPITNKPPIISSNHRHLSPLMLRVPGPLF